MKGVRQRKKIGTASSPRPGTGRVRGKHSRKRGRADAELGRKMSEKSNKIILVMSGILTVVFITVVYMTNRVVPFMMDDLWYSTLLFEETPVSSLADVIRSQVWHYNNWGGRSMTHGILQLILMAGENAADILNVGVTLLLMAAVCLVADHRRLPAFVAAGGMVLGLNADWRMSMFWQSGAANYLYITVFILLFLFCYLRELPEDGKAGARKVEIGGAEAGKAGARGTEAGKTERLSGPGSRRGAGSPGFIRSGDKRSALPGITVWILPLGILAGWSNENMGPAVWIVTLAVIWLLHREQRKIRVWMVLGNLACLAGSVLCIAAPGNAVRSAQIREEEYGVLWRLFLRSYGECKGAMEYLFPALLVLGAVLLVSRFALGQRLDMREKLLLLGVLLSWGAFFLSPHYPGRASFGTMVLCICVILSLAKKILGQRPDLAWPLWAGALLVWFKGMYFCGEWLSLVWGWIK